MTPGRVVKLRVNPRDCMACVDVARAAGVKVAGMSFAQVVSSTLSVLINTVRDQGVIPERQGFEYTDMMQEFQDQPHLDRKRKLQITMNLQARSDEFKPPALMQPNPEVQRARVRFEELAFKIEHDELNVSPDERKEFIKLLQQFYPDKSLAPTAP